MPTGKRWILRLAIGILAGIAGLVSPKTRWLAHYLLGNGRSLRAPQRFILDANIAHWQNGQVISPNGKLFFLVGHFTAQITYDGESWVIDSVDRYDFHPPLGEWACTPLYVGLLTPVVKKMLGKYALPCGEEVVYVSDELWADLRGTPFDTIIRGPIIA